MVTLLVCWYYYVDIHYYFYKRNVVFWNEKANIQPDDFHAISNLNSDSNVYFYHEIYLKARDINNIKAYAVFKKNKSWIKDTSNFNYKIKSQKLIFDLYESFARKFNKKIENVKGQKNLSFKYLKRCGDENYKELNEYLDSIYNSDLTRDEILEIWRPKIDSLLLLYK